MRPLLVLLPLCAVSLWAADVKAPPWEKSNAAGRDLFRDNCAVCHDIDKDQKHTRKLGPSLNRLFQNERLPLSHGKPSRPYVIVRIKFGGALMPAFKNRLSEPEIAQLVNYLERQ